MDYDKFFHFPIGGDDRGHPGIRLWWQGPFLGVLVSTGDKYWELVFLPQLYNDTWNNIALRWFRPQGNDTQGKLEVLINVEVQARTFFWQPAKPTGATKKRALLPATMMLGCHKDMDDKGLRDYGDGFFDEIAFWDTYIFDNTSRMFAGGYCE